MECLVRERHRSAIKALVVVVVDNETYPVERGAKPCTDDTKAERDTMDTSNFTMID